MRAVDSPFLTIVTTYVLQVDRQSEKPFTRHNELAVAFGVRDLANHVRDR
jgi:hypothetical protein